jgi:hypothetical protein
MNAARRHDVRIFAAGAAATDALGAATAAGSLSRGETAYWR